MFAQLTQYNDIGFFILRLVVAIIFIYHALPKFKNAKGMAQGMGMPAGAVLVLGAAEFLSSVGLIFGVYIQLAAFLLAIVMIGAIWMKTVKWHIPFSAMDKNGWEFDLILLAASIVILFGGGGTIGLQ
ncbi:MAG: DoxX family protein [Candidatus Magasanikbacteria bacterium]|nr:DoxX family protein [Candidatus Magasanikbacteria bacterium]